jgi:hypothetical protein
MGTTGEKLFTKSFIGIPSPVTLQTLFIPLQSAFTTDTA